MKTAHPKTQLGVGKLVKFIICLLILAFVGTSARADMESTTVLPQGVTDPVLLFGILSGLSDKFNADGEVQGVTDRFHIQLIGQTLANLSPQLQQLIQTLNASSNQNLGNQLSVGTMDFKSNPQVTYVAPQLDYGLSQNFSIGIGVPLITITMCPSSEAASTMLRPLARPSGRFLKRPQKPSTLWPISIFRLQCNRF